MCVSEVCMCMFLYMLHSQKMHFTLKSFNIIVLSQFLWGFKGLGILFGGLGAAFSPRRDKRTNMIAIMKWSFERGFTGDCLQPGRNICSMKSV